MSTSPSSMRKMRSRKYQLDVTSIPDILPKKVKKISMFNNVSLDPSKFL